MTSTSSTTEEAKLSLPVGHPQAGYVGPDLSFRDGAGELSGEDKKAYDEQNKAREDELKAVQENENKVARAERAEQLKEEKAAGDSASSSAGTSSAKV
jgi:hypothetical protein